MELVNWNRINNLEYNQQHNVFIQLTQLLTNIQYSLAERVVEEDCFDILKTVAGVDVSFSVKNEAVTAAVVLELEGLEITEKKTLAVELFFHYMSGFLGIR